MSQVAVNLVIRTELTTSQSLCGINLVVSIMDTLKFHSKITLKSHTTNPILYTDLIWCNFAIEPSSDKTGVGTSIQI